MDPLIKSQLLARAAAKLKFLQDLGDEGVDQRPAHRLGINRPTLSDSRNGPTAEAALNVGDAHSAGVPLKEVRIEVRKQWSSWVDAN